MSKYVDHNGELYEPDWDSLACILCGRMSCQEGCCKLEGGTTPVVRSYLLKLSFQDQETYRCEQCGAKKAVRVLLADYK